MGVGTCVLHSPLPSPPPPRIIHKAIKWLRNLRYTHRQVLSVSTTAVSIYSVGVSITVSQSGSPLIVPQRVVFCGMLPTWIHERWETLTQMRTVNRFNVGLKVDHVQSSGWGVFPKGTAVLRATFACFVFGVRAYFPNSGGNTAVKRKLYIWAPPIFCQARVSFQRKTLKEIMKRERWHIKSMKINWTING